MKTHVNHPGKQLKVAVDFDGRCIITLPGGNQKEGQLTEEEIEVIAFRVNQITEGAVFFEPPPVDFFTLRKGDIDTLEKQAEALDQLRQTLESADNINKLAVKDAGELQETLSGCQAELIEARENLKDAREAVSLLQEKNEMLEQVIAQSWAETLTHTKDGTPRDSSPETESERDTQPPEGDTEPPSPPHPDLTIHNERPTEEMPLL